MPKIAAHQQYKLNDGTIVPGVTTVLNLLAKPALIYWAWDLGRQGIDFRKARDKAGDIGTIAHEMIETDIKGGKFDPSEYAPNLVEKAENAYLAWLQWQDNFELTTLGSEIQLVSEKYKFGGTLDWIVKNKDGQIWLIDFKSSKDIYDEMHYQIAAYEQLWNENHPDQTISQCHILRLGKENGTFSHQKFNDLAKEWSIFHHLLSIWQLKKGMVTKQGV